MKTKHPSPPSGHVFALWLCVVCVCVCLLKINADARPDRVRRSLEIHGERTSRITSNNDNQQPNLGCTPLLHKYCCNRIAIPSRSQLPMTKILKQDRNNAPGWVDVVSDISANMCLLQLDTVTRKLVLFRDAARKWDEKSRSRTSEIRQVHRAPDQIWLSWARSWSIDNTIQCGFFEKPRKHSTRTERPWDRVWDCAQVRCAENQHAFGENINILGTSRLDAWESDISDNPRHANSRSNLEAYASFLKVGPWTTIRTAFEMVPLPTQIIIMDAITECTWEMNPSRWILDVKPPKM